MLQQNLHYVLQQNLHYVWVPVGQGRITGTSAGVSTIGIASSTGAAYAVRGTTPYRGTAYADQPQQRVSSSNGKSSDYKAGYDCNTNFIGYGTVVHCGRLLNTILTIVDENTNSLAAILRNRNDCQT